MGETFWRSVYILVPYYEYIFLRQLNSAFPDAHWPLRHGRHVYFEEQVHWKNNAVNEMKKKRGKALLLGEQ